MGVRLLNRTNRGVTPTAAGEELRDAVTDPFGENDQAVEALNRDRDAPTGRADQRRCRGGVAAPRSRDAGLIERYPDIEMYIAARDQMVDVFDEGFDAGILYGGTVPKDMIAQRLSADLRWIVAGAPSYFDRAGTPERPDDLQHHHCLGVRLGDDRIYRWKFEGPNGEFAVTVPNKIVLDDGGAVLAMARLGSSLPYGFVPTFHPFVDRGEFPYVLQDWATVGPGYRITTRAVTRCPPV